MSLDDSQQQDCTVYIEQLKSDNPSLKNNAASKLSVIAAVLGHNRIRDELIPYLIQIIEQMDNDNEFLIKVTEGLLELRTFCKTPLQLSIIINPLKILASLDQPSVRDKAIKCLKELPLPSTDKQKKDQFQIKADFYEKYYMPLIKGLNNKNGPYSPRVTACSLIPTTYPNVSPQSQQELRKIFRSLALEENSPLVRRALAQNIAAYANVVSKQIVRSDLLEIWQAFIVDPIDIIKIKALEEASSVAKAFSKEETTEKFFKLIKGVDPNKKSWRIRYALVECLSSLLSLGNLQKDIIKKDFVQIFEELLKDVQAEVRAITLIKCPELTIKLSYQQSFSIFFQYFQKASKDSTKDTPPTVKLALVDSIVAYFKTIDKEKITENGIPILSSLLKDQNQNIRIGIAEKLADLHDVIGKENTIKYIIPLLQTCIIDKKWRFKLAIAYNIKNLVKTLGFDDHREFLEKVITTFLKDHNNSVREQTIKCLSQLKDIIGPQKYLELVQKYLNLLINEPNYIYRVAANTLFQHTYASLQKKDVNELFPIIVKKMETQKVPNVLISFFVLFAKVKNNLTAQTKKEYQVVSKKIQDQKQDEDVLYFAAKADE